MVRYESLVSMLDMNRRFRELTIDRFGHPLDRDSIAAPAAADPTVLQNQLIPVPLLVEQFFACMGGSNGGADIWGG